MSAIVLRGSKQEIAERITLLPGDIRYVVVLTEESLPPPPAPPIDEFEAGLDELASASDSIPVLPPHAYTRESIYGNE